MKVVSWVLICVFILTGCSFYNHGEGETVSAEDEKEELTEEKSQEPAGTSFGLSIC